MSLCQKLISLVDRDSDIISDEFKACLEQAKTKKQSLRGMMRPNEDSVLMALVELNKPNHLEYVLSSEIDVDVNEASTVSHSAETVLHRAIQSDRLKCVSMLLEAGADPNSIDKFSNTPLHYAVVHGESLAAIDLLLSFGANILAQCAVERQPIHNAKHVDVIRRLVEVGADVNARTLTGANALLSFEPSFTAELSMILEAIDTLLNAGVDHNAVDRDGTNCILQFAALFSLQHVPDERLTRQVMHITAFLRSRGVSINARGCEERRLHKIVRGDVLRVMLAANAFVHPCVMTEESIYAREPSLPTLRTLYCHEPQKIDWNGYNQLQQVVCAEETLLEEKQRLAEIASQYRHVLWKYCAHRVVDLSMIFSNLPALIVVEICLFDTECLREIDETKLWTVVESVRKKNQTPRHLRHNERPF